MKIKDVVAQTGLTDRAIRLYISNGLLQPNSNPSYTGRNNYDFSAEDINLLQKVALLRKADFSIEQIRLLQNGGKQAADMLYEFIKTKQIQTKKNEKIVVALKELPPDSQPTLDGICEALSESLNAEEAVTESEESTIAERLESFFFQFICALLFGYFIFLSVPLFTEYTFFSVNFDRGTKLGFLLTAIPIIIVVGIFLLYIKKKMSLKKRIWRGVVSCLLLFASFLTYILGVFCLTFSFYSNTDNPADYLVVDSYVQRYRVDINRLFPLPIPKSAVNTDTYPTSSRTFPKTTTYHYYYESFLDGDYRFDIFAQWQLSPEDFTAEKERIAKSFPAGPVIMEQKGEWAYFNFTDYSASLADGYYFIIFAYNDNDCTIRYNLSYSSFYNIPYHVENLEW